MTRSYKAIPDRISRGTVSVRERLVFLDRTQRHAVLATEAEGHPYASLVAYALTSDMKGLLFITPKSARKYRNILKNNRVSLLIDTRSNTEEDYMDAESVTILGNAGPVRKGRKWSELAGILLAKHPVLKKVMPSPETALIMVEITKCVHVTNFQSVSTWDVETAK